MAVSSARRATDSSCPAWTPFQCASSHASISASFSHSRHSPLLTSVSLSTHASRLRRGSAAAVLRRRVHCSPLKIFNRKTIQYRRTQRLPSALTPLCNLCAPPWRSPCLHLLDVCNLQADSMLATYGACCPSLSRRTCAQRPKSMCYGTAPLPPMRCGAYSLATMGGVIQLPSDRGTDDSLVLTSRCGQGVIYCAVVTASVVHGW